MIIVIIVIIIKTALMIIMKHFVGVAEEKRKNQFGTATACRMRYKAMELWSLPS